MANDDPWWGRQWRVLGNWEPKMFLKRRGDGTFCDVDALWKDIHSDAAIRRMKALGINLSHIHFHKGYGLEHEAESIREAKAWAERLHAEGIRVGVYIGCTLFPETFRHPDYGKMLMQHGEIGWSGAQYFRRYWCHNRPAAIRYFQEVIRTAIEDVGADVLHFDNSFSCIGDQACHCEDCLALFRRFLREDIPDIVAATGYDRPDLLQPPPAGNRDYLASLKELREPGAIAWALFRAETGFRAMERFAAYARSLRQDIAILYNGANLCGITPFSRPDRELEKMDLVDITCVEDSLENPVIVTEDGMPVSRFRAYKAGARARTRVCYYTTGERLDDRLMLAESAAFNYRCLGFVETAMQANHRATADDEPLLRYLADHESLFVDREPWHHIAVLRHHESMLLNPFPSGLSPYVVEQMLFEDHAPFTIIGVRDLTVERLASDFDLVVLPDSKCLRDEEIAALEAYVHDGGGLLSIGNTATATCLNQFRPVWGLGRMFGLAHAPGGSITCYEEVATGSITSSGGRAAATLAAELGSGRAMHMPSLDFRLPDKSRLTRFGGFDWYYHPYWQAPANADVFRDAVGRLLGERWRVRTDLPRHVGLETYKAGDGYRIQFVNYRHPALTPVSHLALRAGNLAEGAWQAVWETPEETRSVVCRQTPEVVVELDLPSFVLLATLNIVPA